VGVDRLADAAAVNCLRGTGLPALIIDLGSALKVDMVSAEGAFAGGAIMPGIGMSARALHEYTDLLPLVEVTDVPPALGTSTVAAMQSGLYWGAVGAARELVARLFAGGPRGPIYLTGGAGALLAGVLADASDEPPQFVPHLTLAGIALAAAPLLPFEELP
jgi:type III pantothenate kinase